MSWPEIRTERLLLRRFTSTDREPFARLNADPEVMAHFPTPLSRAESDSLVDSIEARFRERGFGLWALELTGSGEFLGFTGLSVPRFEAHFTPAVEVGWRLARSAWGHGYATEAATAALDLAFGALELSQVVAFTSHPNSRSRAVMERLGMRRDPADDFIHPRVPASHPLSIQVLYRISGERWRLREREGA